MASAGFGLAWPRPGLGLAWPELASAWASLASLGPHCRPWQSTVNVTETSLNVCRSFCRLAGPPISSRGGPWSALGVLGASLSALPVDRKRDRNMTASLSQILSTGRATDAWGGYLVRFFQMTVLWSSLALKSKKHRARALDGMRRWCSKGMLKSSRPNWN